MNRAIGGRMSPSLAISILALVIAISGRAGALPGHGVVRKGDIAKGAVTANAIAPGAVRKAALHKGAVSTDKLATGAVTGDKIADKAVAGIDLAPDAVTTDKIAPGAVTGDTLGQLVVHTASIPDPDVSPGPGDNNWTISTAATPTCGSGEKLLGGGVGIISSSNNQIAVTRSEPLFTTGWLGQITSNTGGGAGIEAVVLCLQ